MATLRAKRSDWVRLFSTVAAFVKEAKVSVNDGRATILAIDPANIAIVKGSIECEGSCDDFSFNVEQAMKALNAAGGEDIQFDFDEYMSDMTITGNAKVKLPLSADLGEIKDIKREIFDGGGSTGVLMPADIEQCVSYCLWSKESVVTFTFKENSMNVRTGEGRLTAEVDMAGSGDAVSKYPLDYFDAMLKQAKGCGSINILIPESDYPMLAEWKIGTSEFSIVIAPRIDQE